MCPPRPAPTPTVQVSPIFLGGITWTVGVGAGLGGHMNINNGTFGYGPEVGIYGVVGIGGIIK